MAIINNAPVNEAVLSNVGEIGEFRIRNSAKAFSILSSGLYANKIRAIVRELSCNAVDSHIAANKQETPFDVHLPNQLEPWFAIRDYGTGLTHDQVTNIYTTYFESTKSNSNEFIGALGLGSKSPFSYTDNFTVTAIKDGVKGIYSAFINADGVPSIAKMMSEETDEPAGVEVKFSVNDRYDFDKFKQEARQVYTYFKLRPVVSGSTDFKFYDNEYETKDIIPGVHSQKESHRRSIAIMGNISYPIDIPNADQVLGDLRHLLSCGLEMHFAIGELDFQASREGLSYIPQTIDAIKRKLTALNAQLAVHLAVEADKISNLWERAEFLAKKAQSGLWSAAVSKYATDTKLATYDVTSYGKLAKFTFEVDVLAKKYNIVIHGIQRNRGSKNCSALKPSSDSKKDATGQYVYTTSWNFQVDCNAHFVVNDTKIGATERAKFHYRQQDQKDVYTRNIFVLDAADKTKPMNTKAFFKAMLNPPAVNIVQASSLLKKERADSGLGKNVTILVLQERGSGGYYREREMVWRDAGKADSFDAATTYYYLPLSGFEVKSDYGMNNVKEFYNDLKECGLDGIRQTVYGVRKGDIEFIKTQKNWINIEQQIATVLSKPIDNKLVMSLVLNAVDSFNLLQYNVNIVDKVTNANSPYAKLVTQFKGFDKIRYNESSLKRLCNRYAVGVTFNPEAIVQKFVSECATISKQYPLLQYLRSAPNEDVANYVNLIDTQKGI
jgi:hypothetical protein